MLTLITGGARSGKSRFAQSLCRDAARVVFIATALPSDSEMQARIANHRHARPAGWRTVEEPLKVPAVAALHAKESDIVLVDCVTIWLSNLLYEMRERDLVAIEQVVTEQAAKLVEASKLGTVIAVTNEVGAGIVPESPIARQFRDIQGFVNQKLAFAADSVYFVIAGIPARIKPGKELVQ